jgi:hypothetical protein
MTQTFASIPTNINNITTFKDFINVANQSGAGYLFMAIDILIFAVLFISLTAGFGWESAFLSSGFIGIILTLLFLYMGVVPFWLASWFVAGIVVMILYIVLSSRYD